MLITYPLYILRLLFTIAANIFKKGLRPPEYVTFTLHGSYTDLRHPPEGFLQSRLSPRKKSLQELTRDLKIVAKNSQVKGIIFFFNKPELTLSQVQSLTRVIEKIRAGDKEVIAWSTNYDTLSYCLAAAGSRVLLQEGGVVYTLGFASRQLYMKEALAWCGVELDVVRVSPFKSALDRLIRSDMSDEVREMTEWLMDSYYRQFIEAVARGRSLEEKETDAMVEKTPLFGNKAVDAGAIDGVVNAEDLPVYLGSRNKPVRLASWDECKKCFPRPLPLPPGRHIAILRVQGNIVDGKSRRPPARPPLPAPFIFNEQTGDLSFVRQARLALKDRRARAVLLYIDSGGGSAASTEAITSILGKLAAKKPLVALMGPVAASGGYYVATAASHIVAEQATITGSIGVIAAKVVNARLLEKLLLNRETIERGKKDLFASQDEPFTEEERSKALGFINHIYEIFLKRVADSRSMEHKVVEEVGGGKVWTGQQAQEHGLVDELGSLETALARLRREAGLPDNTPLIDIPYSRHDTAPLPLSSDWIEFTLSNLNQFQDGKALLAGPPYFQRP
ncbi:MAG: signal peptide peptidase SppA [Bacillota bacterium]